MPPRIEINPPPRLSQPLRRLPRPTVMPPPLVRLDVSVRRPNLSAPSPASSWNGFRPDPYIDYGRFLTVEGGMLFSYKDLDLRFRHTLWRACAWTISTGSEGWFLLFHSSLRSTWINVVCLLAMAVLNWLIVARPVEVYRRVEIRPDCMIIEGADVFWVQFMECGWPVFQRDKEGNQVLRGIYGSRFVEYFTVRRFDEFDRAPEVFKARLYEAMDRVWIGSPPAALF